MKNTFLLITLLLSFSSYSQNKLDSNSFEFLCETNYKVDFIINNNYLKVNYHRAFIPTYKTWSCMPYFFKEALINKKNENHYLIYFDFNETASSTNEAYWMTKKYFKPDFDVNTNYLGGKNCQIERDRDLMKNVFTRNDFVKFNADTMLCMRVDSNAREKNDPELNDFIYVVMHKQNIGDIYVCFTYKKEYEFEVMVEIKNLWKIIKFK
jgi:hypothetical protein